MDFREATEELLRTPYKLTKQNGVIF